MNKNSKIFVAGASGMVGSAIIRNLLRKGHTNLVGSFHSREPDAGIFLLPSDSDMFSKNLDLVRIDLTNQEEVRQFFKKEKPDYVVIAAAKVGGIYANNTYPAEFIHNNLTMQGNIIHAAYEHGVDRLLFLGSSCIYPKLAPQPMKETHLLTDLLEPTNEPYAIAKIAGIKMCESYNRQYGTRFVAVMPTNLYGPNDNFDLEKSHVLPALMRKFHEAKEDGKDHVMVWGTGEPRREFLHVDDMADACVFVLNLPDTTMDAHLVNYPQPCFVNVGTGVDGTIRELAESVKKVVGFEGKLVFDTSKPDGTMQKLLDVTRLTQLGWKAKIDLDRGLKDTYRWYCRRS